MSESKAAEAPAGKAGKKKFIIIGVALLLLGAGGGAAAYFTGALGGKDKEHEAEEAGEDKDAHGKKGEKDGHGEKGDKKEKDHGKKEEKKGEHKEEEEKKDHGGKVPEQKGISAGPNGTVYYEFPSFLVNLNMTDAKRATFLKATIQLELQGTDDIEKIDLLKPRLTDIINTYLRELRPSDINGSAGLFRLKEELLVRVNQVADPVKINDILFKEVLVQ